MRFAAIAAAIAVSVSIATVAEAKTCKELVTASSQTRVAGSQQDREKRATANATQRWCDDARWKAGLLYRFWSRAEDKKIECKSTPKTTTCVVSARPCRLI
ncbi:MAG: hypothetical protein KGP27_05105 [Hyphomicrobiales bacterium]|nr:hypothetical protein [Hyphomicrobiales bacterium]